MPNDVDPPVPPVDPATIDAPIDPADPAFAPLLARLQGNILKSHGRDYAVHAFFRFTGAQAASRRLICALSDFATSAAEQAAQAARHKAHGAQEVFGSVLLSANGLGRLGLALPAGFGDARIPPPPLTGPVTFAQPMKAAAAVFGDDPTIWDDGYKAGDIDGMLMLAAGVEDAVFGPDALPTALLETWRRAETMLAGLADVVAFEIGRQQRRGDDAVEQFGFVDGISQPVMLTPDLPPQRDANDPSAGLDLVLVKDPFTTEPSACGSFFVFRKLEQDVRAFRAMEARLRTALALPDGDLGGAMVVGRFRDGTPVALSPQAGTALAKANDFNYAVDPGTPPAFPQKCPFQAHIRKTNPRGDTARQFGGGAATDAVERKRRLARRGITYGSRDPGMADAPSAGVGLLFQCFQSSIPDQFAFMQNQWVNNVGFVRPAGAGQDPVIGQGARTTAATWPTAWGGPGAATLPDLGQLVRNRGGEFFFAPSLPTLRALGG